MVWSENDCPPAMRRLHPEVRRKALDIANAVIEDGREEEFAIRIAIACATQWARRSSPDWRSRRLGS